MDSLRAILMSFGVVLHAALAYDTSRKWVVSDASGSAGYGIWVTIIHMYRMPLFFLVAGFFTSLAFDKYTRTEFVRIRFIRIVLPFFATLVTANALLQWCFVTYGLREFTIAHWVGQLWFLAYLFFYLLVFYLASYRYDWLRAPIVAIERVCEMLGGVSTLYLIFIAAHLAFRLAIKVFDLWDTTLLGFVDLPNFLHYAVYFIAGLITFRSNKIYDFVTRPSGWIYILAIALATAAVTSQHLPTLRTWVEARSILQPLLEWSAAYVGAIAILGIFRRYCNFNSRWSRFFSETSYSVFLFHGPFLVGFAILLLPVSLPAIVKYLLVVFLSLACTVALHALVISRVPILMTLFNGKVLSKQRISGVP